MVPKRAVGLVEECLSEAELLLVVAALLVQPDSCWVVDSAAEEQ